MRALFFKSSACRRSCHSVTHKQSHQRIGANLSAPVAVDRGVESSACGQGVVGIKELSRAKDARAAVLQKDFHLTAQHKKPLRRAGAVKAALKAHRALAQLVTPTGHQRRQAALRRAFVELKALIAKACATIGVGEEDDFWECGHGRQWKVNEASIVAEPTGFLAASGIVGCHDHTA